MKPRVQQETTRFAWRTADVTPDRFGIPGKSLTFSGTNAGTAQIDTTNNVAGYSLSEGQNTVAYGVIPLPSNWGGRYYRMSVAWFPAGTAAGNVRLGFGTRRIADGTAFTSALESIAPIIDASSGAATTAVVTKQNFATALPTNIGTGEFMAFDIRRRGDVGADDTYDNAIYVIAVEIALV